MDIQTKKKYQYWQWRTLITLMIGYALYYFVRKHFSVAMPALEAELGISKTQLGLFLTLNGVIYGFSRFVNGFLADRPHSFGPGEPRHMLQPVNEFLCQRAGL